MKTIGVIGAGAWGTALSVVANRAGNEVMLWTRNPDVLASIRNNNRNDVYLPSVYLDPAIQVSQSLEEVCQNDVVILAVPAQHMRSVCIAIPDYLEASVPLLIASKGIEKGTGKLLSEIIARVLPRNPVAVLSGPNFAHEVVAGKPTASTIACQDQAIGEMLQFSLGTTYFRPYVSQDVVGTQIGGAVKNVIAIACGITIGRGFGENARAALITRGLREIGRLIEARNGDPKTVMGLSGVGDLVLTCSGDGAEILSRNMKLGYRLGQGMSLEEALDLSNGVCEGVATAQSVRELASRHKVAMPISEAVDAVLHQGRPIAEMIQALLERPFRAE